MQALQPPPTSPAERHQQSKVGLSDESLLLDSPVLPWLGKALQRLAKGQTYLLDISYANLVKDWKAALGRLGVPAVTCRTQLRQMSSTQIGARHQTTRLVGKRLLGKEVQGACSNQPGVLQAPKEDAAALPGDGTALTPGGPKTFQPDLKINAPRCNVLELFRGCARLSRGLCKSWLPCNCFGANVTS